MDRAKLLTTTVVVGMLSVPAAAEPGAFQGLLVTTVGRQERGSSAWRVLPVDLTNDGCQEMVVINGGDQYPQELVLYRDGCKPGTTANSQILASDKLPGRFVQVRTAQLNDDNLPDLLTAIFTGDTSFPSSGFEGAGIRYTINNTAQPSVGLTDRWLLCNAAVRDFTLVDSDNDGALELLVVGETQDSLANTDTMTCPAAPSSSGRGKAAVRVPGHPPTEMNFLGHVAGRVVAQAQSPQPRAQEEAGRNYFMALWDLKSVNGRWRLASKRPRWNLPLPPLDTRGHQGAPSWVRVFDFNGDGWMDAASSFDGIGTVFVFGGPRGLPDLGATNAWKELPTCGDAAPSGGTACMDPLDGRMSYAMDVARFTLDGKEAVRVVESRGCFPGETNCLPSDSSPNAIEVRSVGAPGVTRFSDFTGGMMPTAVAFANLCPGIGGSHCTGGGSWPGIYFGQMSPTLATQPLRAWQLDTQPATGVVVEMEGTPLTGWFLDLAIVDREVKHPVTPPCEQLRLQSAPVMRGPVVTLSGLGPFRIDHVCTATAEVPPCLRADEKANHGDRTSPRLCWRPFEHGRLVQISGAPSPDRVWIGASEQARNDVVVANALPVGTSYVIWNPNPALERSANVLDTTQRLGSR